MTTKTEEIFFKKNDQVEVIDHESSFCGKRGKVEYSDYLVDCTDEGKPYGGLSFVVVKIEGSDVVLTFKPNELKLVESF